MPDRTPMLTIVKEMPEEAFSWFVVWALTSAYGSISEFQSDSKKSIVELRDAAREYMDKQKLEEKNSREGKKNG